MALDIRTAQTQLEDLVRDTILYALGRRLTACASVAEVRAVGTKGASGGTKRSADDLVPIVVSSVVTAIYRWSPASVAADTGTSVLRPDDVESSEPGRWLAWTSELRFCPTVGGNSYALSEVETGVLERVILLDKSMSEDDVTGLLMGAVPSVVIEAADDEPDDMVLMTGYRYTNRYRFTVSAVCQSLRDRREAAQASDVGANTIDGWVKSLLCGTQLSLEEEDIRNVEIGRGYNWVSKLAQRRVVRSRQFTLLVTEGFPAAPNDYGLAESVEAQAAMTDLGEQDEWDDDNYVSDGVTVSLGVGLTRSVAAGTALIDGEEVTYDGEMHTFGASMLIYRDLASDGTMTFTEVPIGASAPALAAGSLRVAVTTTDAVGVVADRFIAIRKTAYGPVIVHEL